MLGNRGEKMRRPRNMRKNREVMKTMVPTTERKGRGVGQAFAISSS
jgi:hypothetical protein